MRYETLYKRPSFAMQETAFYRAICALLECEKRQIAASYENNRRISCYGR